jgi:hypothetical protein
MASQHNGNYRAKHPQDIKVDPAIIDRVAASIVNNCIACKIAHAIAEELGISPSQVGIAIDLQNGRIMACQLGLFGYAKGKKIVAQDETELKTELKSAIQKKLIDGRISCAAVWQIADAHGIARLELGCACEGLGVKINQCQLGAF